MFMKEGFMMGRISSLAMVAACMAAPSIANAQSNTATPDTKTNDSAQSSGDIVVTAERREERARDVPISISTLDQSAYSNITAGGADIRALSSRVPNVNAESTYGRVYQRFYIRGLGNPDYTINAQSPVSIYMDDVLEENAYLRGMPAFDIQRIEVLRGPQGTLYGKNATAGAINIVTVKPSDELSGYAKVNYGNMGTTNVEGAIGGGLIKDVLSARVSVSYQHRDDWVKNIVTGNKINGYDDLAARGQLLFTPRPISRRCCRSICARSTAARRWPMGSMSIPPMVSCPRVATPSLWASIPSSARARAA
jgi:iron complex outermembrane receptor protein